METAWDHFEEVEYPPRAATTLSLTNDITSLSSRPSPPLTPEAFKSYLDVDGRLVDEHRLRKAVFQGGVDPDIRKDVWKFLFKLYPMNSTYRERDVLMGDYSAKYKALKHRWKIILRSEVDRDGDKLLHPNYLKEIPEAESPEIHLSSSSGEGAEGAADRSQQETFLTFQAQVYAGRQNMNRESFVSSLKVIDKDVPRTDRGSAYFKGDGNPHLRTLRDVLVTYAVFHPDVGYAQGMNDIASLFLQVFDSEVETYWCFEHYMNLEPVRMDFLEEGMLRKLNHCCHLLEELDPDLLIYLQHIGIGDLTFCHRWLLLSFKREFTLPDSFKCFEILRSQHLEVSSLVAERLREVHRRQDFQSTGGKNKVEEAPGNTDFTFDVFLCVTILLQHRSLIFDCSDTAEIFQLFCSVNSMLNLDELLLKAEVLFYKYCKKTVHDCFLVLDLPSPTECHVPSKKS